MGLKILFLDHDEVIATKNSYFNQEIWFDFNCINVLNSIINETDCEIVVSSDNRIGKSIRQMCKIYEESGIIKKPLDYTPWLKLDRKEYITLENISLIRTTEINLWLNTNFVNKWCAIDDLVLQLNNFVHINSENGLNIEHFNKIVKFLK